MQETIVVNAKPWWMSLTNWFNIAVFLSVVLIEAQELLHTFPEGTAPEWLTKALVGATAVVNIILRFKTQLPVTASNSPQPKQVTQPVADRRAA